MFSVIYRCVPIWQFISIAVWTPHNMELVIVVVITVLFGSLFVCLVFVFLFCFVCLLLLFFCFCSCLFVCLFCFVLFCFVFLTQDFLRNFL